MYISSSVSGLLRNIIGLYYTKEKGFKYYVLQLTEIGKSKIIKLSILLILYMHTGMTEIYNMLLVLYL